MKKIFIYALTLIALAACTAEDAVVEEVLEQPEEEEPLRGIVAVKEDINIIGPITSRSSMYFDKVTNKSVFRWDDADNVGVINVNATVAQRNQIKFCQILNGNVDRESLYRSFETPAGVRALVGNQQYVAWYCPANATYDNEWNPIAEPYWYDLVNYETYKVSYENQDQKDHVDMRVYNGLTASNATDYATYVESEKKASAHLSKYDYLCATPQTTTADGSVFFHFNRVGSTARFYIKYPDAHVFEELQLYNPELDFTIQGTVNVADLTITPIKTGHVMKLKLGGEDGFDLSDKSSIYYNGTNSYLIAYLMLAPIDMSQKCQSTLYLIAHEKEHPTIKHYYKATLTSKPNLERNQLFKWTVSWTSDDPIEFTETTVEDWKQTEGFENDGDDNGGTSGW